MQKSGQHEHTQRYHYCQWTSEITIYRKRRRLLKINTILLRQCAVRQTVHQRQQQQHCAALAARHNSILRRTSSRTPTRRRRRLTSPPPSPPRLIETPTTRQVVVGRNVVRTELIILCVYIFFSAPTIIKLGRKKSDTT